MSTGRLSDSTVRDLIERIDRPSADELLRFLEQKNITASDFPDGEARSRFDVICGSYMPTEAQLRSEPRARSRWMNGKCQLGLLLGMPCLCRFVHEAAVLGPFAWCDEFDRSLDTVAGRLGAHWVSWQRCRACLTNWLVGMDQVVNDIWAIQRLSGDQAAGMAVGAAWPDSFDEFSALCQLAAESGNQMRFVDPLFDPLSRSLLVDAIAKLASERPGVSVSTLARTLNLRPADARALVDEATRRYQVKISNK